MTYQRTDIMLMELLQERKTITAFFDAIFGFLRRNTDFYSPRKGTSGKVGIAQDTRKEIIYGAMQRYDQNDNSIERDEICELQTERDMKVESVTTTEEKLPGRVQNAIVAHSVYQKYDCAANIALLCTEDGKLEAKNKGKMETETTLEKSLKESESIAQSSCKQSNPTKQLDTESMQHIDVAAPTHKTCECLQENALYAGDINLHVRLPPVINEAKSVSVEIKPNGICVRNKEDPEQVLLHGKFTSASRNSDVIWKITEGSLIISLDRVHESLWNVKEIREEIVDENMADANAEAAAEEVCGKVY